MVTCDKGVEDELHLQWQAEGKEHGGIVFFRGRDHCKSITIMMRELLFLSEAADYEVDLRNKFWRVKA
ncbi:MAG: hypothetical protein K8L91_12335 [Anaerolineae bacterium]|nr:hypothetical protein [Anaerolineae bacterium]